MNSGTSKILLIMQKKLNKIQLLEIFKKSHAGEYNLK